MNKLYNVGAYIRLSVENTAYDNDESMSIENQREMLSQFISVMPGWIEKQFYIDNGFSGGNFHRPAFMEMMDDVRSGEINLVLVKDLSRFGRNYLEAGHYLENELPSFGCRFVSLSENIDTENGENDIIPFINGMNDYYLKNISDKVRLAMTAMAKNGQYVSGKDPYGYIRSSDGHNKLIVDPEAAAVVREIFELRKSGAGFYKIAQILNKKGYLPPMLYYCKRTNYNAPASLLEKWKTSVIRKMLYNELYIGNMAQFKRMRITYRGKKETGRAQSEWIRVENTHEPIVSTPLWDRVQEINRIMKDSRKKKHEYSQHKLFVGRLYCADCGRVMTAHSYKYMLKKTNSEIISTTHTCLNYRESGGVVCSIHSITEVALRAIVLEQIRFHAEAIVLDETKMLQSLHKQIMGELSVNKTDTAQEIKELKRKIAGIDTQTEKLYEDRLDGVISEDAFTHMIESLENQRQETETRLTAIEQSDVEIRAKTEDIARWVQLIKEKSAVTKIDGDLLDSLIDKIEVGEKITVDGKQEQSIRIHFKYVGVLK